MAKKNKHQSNAARKKQQQRHDDAKTRVVLEQALTHGHFVKGRKQR